MKNLIVGIDPGHGGTNIGCFANGIHEESYTLQVGECLRDMLLSQGVKVLMSRTHDESVSFEQRAARLAAASMVLVIHVNSAGQPMARDLRCFALPGDTIASRIGTEIERVAPAPVTPETPHVLPAIKVGDTSHAYNVLVKHHPRPAVLVEMFFCTNPESANFAVAPWGRASFATAMLAGILRGWQMLADNDSHEPITIVGEPTNTDQEEML